MPARVALVGVSGIGRRGRLQCPALAVPMAVRDEDGHQQRLHGAVQWQTRVPAHVIGAALQAPALTRARLQVRMPAHGSDTANPAFVKGTGAALPTSACVTLSTRSC